MPQQAKRSRVSNSTIIPLVREVFIFHPPRRTGILLHGVAVLFFTIIGIFGLWQASQAESGPTFLVYLFGALIAIAFIPGLTYRMYALQRARYTLARDGIGLYWGLRREEIPINSINWVRSADQHGLVLPKPFLHVPGAVLGVRSQNDGTPVEFLAARDTNLVMIATPDRIFAISPANPTEFLQTYRKLSEYGSLAPIQSVSDYPTFLLSRSWADRPARVLLLVSALLALGLILWVSLSITNHPQISLRLNTEGSPTELVPGIRLLLLPVSNTFFFIIDLLLGLFFYRREDTKSLGYLMWASSALTSLLFYGAVYYILQAV
jgi:hypothetical protein